MVMLHINTLQKSIPVAGKNCFYNEKQNKNYYFPNASDGIGTLGLKIMSQVFFHCANGAQSPIKMFTLKNI